MRKQAGGPRGVEDANKAAERISHVLTPARSTISEQGFTDFMLSRKVEQFLNEVT
jgi:hypothetical protein